MTLELGKKKDIFDIRRDSQSDMDKLTAGVKPFIERYGFYPSVFYNENDINDSFRGIRAAILDLDDYKGVFVVQDSPDTPIDNFKGVEFRTSLSKSTRERAGAHQLLWTVQDLTGFQALSPISYDPEPSIQFSGAVCMMENGEPFPQHVPRLRSAMSAATCGLKTQIGLKYSMFKDGAFVDIGGTYLNQDEYFALMGSHLYGLSVRGWGNWDYRFYELMARGRIPVHINTDDELLFEDIINWGDLIVRVDNLNELKTKVEEFHSQFTDDKSVRHHLKRIVNTYHSYLSFPAFCKRFESYYEDDLNKWL